MPSSEPNIKIIFGTPAQPWPTTFRPVNDTLRGGSSTSSFLLPTASRPFARFSGHLDTKTLGGAGFSSQCLTFSPSLSLPEDTYDALTLSVVCPRGVPDGSPSSFVLALKNDVPADRGEGRRESVISYEYVFDLRELEKQGHAGKEVRLVARWEDFTATFRGREQKEAPALNPASIYELSFMCRSNFDSQSGDFELDIGSLGAVYGASNVTRTKSWWTRLVEMLSSWTVIFSRGWWSRKGAVRLP